MENSFRIHTEITKDAVLNVNMRQDFDFLEVLSLKLRQADAYKLHSSNYGVIVGRVLANDAFGIPNAKVSVFIANEGGETSEIEKLYPYSTIRSTDSDGRRYNLLPDYSDDDCYRVVGTMPNKRLVLDNNTVLEVFDKYWKYSTVTNNAGDYMIFGIPSGNQEIKVDLDLSDIGILSQRPTDFTYKGYNLSMFDSPTQFKESTNLESLPQIFSQNKSVFVYPFWGDVENGIAAITRSDIQIQYKFEPTCVFMGSIVTDNDSNAINHKCAPDINNGMNNQLVTGEGNIEMIRKTPDGLVEEFQVQTGESLIDANGAWCYQIPMNLDYVGMDEYGNIVPTDNPSKGIPTRAQVRFRISKNETGDEGFSRHTAKYLVPMNPIFDETKVVPTIPDEGKEIEKMYNFGSNTPQSCFRDLYWNNVYSVKNYIPKVQVAHRAVSKNYSALKGANLAEDQNQLPFNKLRFDIPFVYMVLCIVYTMIVIIVTAINAIKCVVYKIVEAINWLLKKIKKVFKFFGLGKLIPTLDPLLKRLACIPLSAGLSDDNTAYYPGCWCGHGNKCGTKGYGDAPADMDPQKCRPSQNNSELIDKIQQNLANEFKIVKLDLYQDWVNGVLYMPLWYWRKRKKKTFLFGLIKRRAKNQFCSCDTIFKRLKTYVTCNIVYKDTNFGLDDGRVTEKEVKWHKNRHGKVSFMHGLIKQVENKDGLNVYYYSAIQSTDTNNPKQLMIERGANFKAIRLYATDIILLGNLNENNIYGVPQLFKALPSTTANIPPIATISEPASDEDEQNVAENDNDAAYTEDSGVTLTTGMDWGYNKRAKDDTPKFSRGLFMDLACTYANTKAKSCINVERLSELGVNYDTNYEISYRSGGDVLMGPITADGFISKYELDDLENRAMFATLNHVGFIPQAYQDEKDYYDTQVHETNTNYLIPKFHYLYPVDFDGRMQLIMNRYKHGFQYSETDYKDESYIKFRLGSIDGRGKKGRINHFYLVEGGNNFSMPLYNNSYYFYFGLIKGNTAIDKFNKKFFAECFQNSKDWFSFDVEKQGKSYCVDAYKTEHSRCSETNEEYFDKDKAHGKIKITSDDIQIPYSYELKDVSGSPVSTGTGITSDEVLICDLDNSEYTIKLTDGNGKSITRQIVLEREKLTVEYDVTPLGTKFYNTEASPKGYICDKENEFYGKITFTGFTMDGYEGTIQSIDGANYDGEKYIFTINGQSEYHKSNGIVIRVEMKVIQPFIEGTDTAGCTCLGATPTDKCKCDFENTGKIITFFIYEPAIFMITATQVCGEDTDNVSITLATVENGKNFNAYLNEMPLKFMLGTTDDNFNMEIATNSLFYKNTAATDVNDVRLSGWFGVHDETSYRFNLNQNKAIEVNERVWSDFVDYYDEFSTVNTKLDIIKFKFEKMFNVANTTYVTENSDPEYTMTYEGGVNPVLSRVLAPYYSDTENLISSSKSYLYEDNNVSVVDTAYPNIVSKNYKGFNSTTKTFDFNPLIPNRTYLGNYFAVFTKNGGYTSSTGIDESIKVRKIPNYAAVNVKDGTIKELGNDETGPITSFKKAYNSTDKTRPHFRAMYLDRRFDYDFIVFAPIVTKYISLPGGDNITWKSGRISGTTYNGIEMAYDNEYNIISGTQHTGLGEDGEVIVTSVTENQMLEYSYSVPSATGDCVTKYNYGSSVIKKPYSASINGIVQLTDKFWSTRNNSFATGWGEVPCFPSHAGQGNDWFNKNNYPTIRILDVGNIIPLPLYAFEYIPCTYNGMVERSETDEIKCIVEGGYSEGFTLNFEDSLEFIGPNDDNKQYGNLVYNITETTHNGYSVFSASTMNLRFKMKPFSSEDDFDVYTSAPRVLGVMKGGENQITKLKRLVNSSRQSIDSTIAGISEKIENKTLERPDGVKLYDAVPTGSKEPTARPCFPFFKKDDEFITSDEPDYYNVVYKRENINIGNLGEIVALIFKRCYINSAGDNLTKYISTYEFSEMYDARRIGIKPIEGSVSGSEVRGSYVTLTLTDVSTEGSTNIPPQEEGGQETSVTTTTDGSVSGYTQTIELDVELDSSFCQVFNDADTFGFSMDIGMILPLNLTYVVASTDDIEAVVDRTETTDESRINSIRIIIKWPHGLGYLGNGRWSNGAACTLYCKMPSGFVYKLGTFKLTGETDVSRLSDGQSSETKELSIEKLR